MAIKYQPPSWCRPPISPEEARQELRFIRDEASGTATPLRSSELSDKAVYTVGRADTSDVVLWGELASRAHAAVLQDAEGGKFLVDLKSANGSFLDGKRLAPHAPTPWSAGAVASFGSGPKAEFATLGPAAGGGPAAKKRKTDEEPVAPAAAPAFSLYDDLPDAQVTSVVPKVAEESKMEPMMPVTKDPTKIVFLDIDGCLRPVHGRQDAFKNAKTMDINGIRVPLLGSGEAKAGIDFWPSAMRALKVVVQKTGARIVLSSDWRKADELKEGIGQQFEEHRIPPLFGQTPDLDAVGHGVLKAIHTSFREKRCKEIKKWLRTNGAKVTNWVAIDDIDLSQPDKEQVIAEMRGSSSESVFLDPGSNFVRCNPMTGLTMELARIAICFLNGTEVTQDMVEAAYGSKEVA